MLAERHNPAEHGPCDGLVEDRLDAAEGDDQVVLDDGATPLGHARLVEVGSVLLDAPAREPGEEGHLGLGLGDLVVLLRLLVVAVDLRGEEHLTGVWVEHHDGAGELVGGAHEGGVGDRADRDVPGLEANCRGETLIHNGTFSPSGRVPNV